MQKLVYLTATLGLIGSCANIKPKYTAHESQGIEQTSKTPTAIINEYQDVAKKRDLDTAISTGVLKSRNTHFLRKELGSKYKFWIKYFTTRNKNGFERFAKNGERYRDIIEKTFERYGLPKELYYVGLIESGYMNHARSHAGAVGPWQFIKDTAKRYGLKVTKSVDERRNIYKSTQAAALYFQDLYNIFGSWELALAAYNAGEYGIIRRIRGANTREYYELSKRKIIPKETRHYVPKVLAAMHVYKNAEQYKINIRESDNNFYNKTKTINIKNSISLNKLAKKIGVPKSTIKQLNHDLKSDYLPYMGRNGVDIYIPDYKNISKEKLASLSTYKRSRPQKVVTRSLRSSGQKQTASSSKSYHKVRSNESLYSISKRYNVKISTLRALNRIKGSHIYIGQRIKLPTNSQPMITKNTYTIKSGDNLTKIAKSFGISVRRLKSLNGLSRARIYPGQKIKVPEYQKKIYTVKPGDNLITIARNYDTDLKWIKEVNNINHGRIYPGQKIIVELKTI